MQIASIKKIILIAFLACFFANNIFAASWQKIATSSSVSSSIVDIFKDGSGIALYKLDGNANDAGGTYNGTPSNITYTTGKIGQAAVFNGSSSAILASPKLAESGAYTISVWTKFNSTNQGFIRQGVTGDIAFDCGVNSSGNPYLASYYGSDWVAKGNSVLSSGQWYHIAYVFNYGGAFSIYVNGAMDTISYTYGSANFPNNSTTATIFSIGGASFAYNSAYFFSGALDSIRIYNRALSAAEVQAIYQAGN